MNKLIEIATLFNDNSRTWESTRLALIAAMTECDEQAIAELCTAIAENE